MEVDDSDLLAGPAIDMLAHAGAAGTGGLETSALALGQARAALGPWPSCARPRRPGRAGGRPLRRLARRLVAADRPRPRQARRPLPGQVRGQANALVLRLTQAYLTARKGTGFLRTEPAQRWARQALFFLVWSCPGPVAQAAIRDLAGLCSA